MPDTVVQKLDRCAVLLAECRTAEQVKRLADVSEAARVYAKRVGASREVVNQAAEYKLRAERRLGEILAITERAKRPPGPGRGKVGSPAVPTLSDVATLSDMGLSKKVSSRAQKLAAVPADIFEAKIAQAKGSTKELGFSTFADRAAREIVHRAKLSEPLPEVKYRVIYADPPWKYRDSGLDDYGHAERHYPSMSIEEMCELPVKSLSAEDAVLFLWVTAPMLEESFRVIHAWRFAYKTFFTSDKVRHNFGHYISVRQELLLLSTRGSMLRECPKLYDSVQTIERSGRHSEKPEKFREIIEAMYPSGPRIELFARKPSPGWATWGNENG